MLIAEQSQRNTPIRILPAIAVASPPIFIGTVSGHLPPMSVAIPARACGIDFGTSNSTAGWLRPGQPPLLALEEGKFTLPSVIFFNADENTVSVGRAGLNEYLDGYEGRLMRALKSLLGSSLMEGRTEVQGRSKTYIELLTQFIAELKQRAEAAADRSFD